MVISFKKGGQLPHSGQISLDGCGCFEVPCEMLLKRQRKEGFQIFLQQYFY